MQEWGNWNGESTIILLRGAERRLDLAFSPRRRHFNKAD
jgi:hypothetical protein